MRIDAVKGMETSFMIIIDASHIIVVIIIIFVHRKYTGIVVKASDGIQHGHSANALFAFPTVMPLNHTYIKILVGEGGVSN